MADPDLQIRGKWGEGGGDVLGGHPEPEIWGSVSKNNFFSALRGSVWCKNKGGGLGAGSPGPFPGSATEFVIIQVFLSYLSVDVSSDCVFR